MKRNTGIKKRGRVTHTRNPVVLFIAEGNNKTEENYLSNFQKRTGIRIVPANGNDTDPVNMISQLRKQAKEMGLSVKYGDKAYCIIDTDTDRAKQSKIDIACSKQTSLVRVITSSPCFEEWFLCHFRKSTGYQTSAEAIAELKKHLPEYEKNKNIFPQIKDKTSAAIDNAKDLEQHHLKQGKKIHSTESNPSTEVYKIVEYITQNQNG